MICLIMGAAPLLAETSGSLHRHLSSSSRVVLSHCLRHSTSHLIQVFLDILKTKTRVQGWSRFLNMPVTTSGLVDHSLMFTDYGLIPLTYATQDVL
jgi:hypothetical protein